MGWRLPWARRLQSPCRTGESSLAAHSTAPTRAYELAGIARKPCARRQRRSSASGALLVAAAEGLEIQHLLGPPRRRLPLHCCASRAAEVEAGQLPRLVVALVTCTCYMCAQSAVAVSCVTCSAVLMGAVGLGDTFVVGITRF